ncbi:MAG: class I SAM-dependent methyltransferase, partial [Desulfitobacteriaceae bacterium]|nr:class I SAM-dependent methyltransferase [Desulfitobacteriaceae bacterium]
IMYEVLSQSYDRFVNWKERLAYELPFLERLLDSVPHPQGERLHVLDTACGTGMHAIALAQRGYIVVGTDLSPSMIAQAKQNALAAGTSLRFETVGFGAQAALLGEKSFDAVLCLGNSLPHLLTEEALDEALADFYRLLRPKGAVLIQNRNFDQVMQNRQREMEPQSIREEGREWLFIRFYDFLENGLIRFNFLTLSRQADQPWKQDWQSSFLRPLLADELSKSLLLAGFPDIQLFGNLAGEPFNPQSSANLVVWARRA